MELTTKEKDLLKDLLEQEMLCILKYENYAEKAHSCELKELFLSMADIEREHHRTVAQMLEGKTTDIVAPPASTNNMNCQNVGYTDEDQKKEDEFMCKDMLTAEKHVSALYNTSVFEFTNPDARKMLNRIQADEQQHGERLYAYMKNNNMTA